MSSILINLPEFYKSYKVWISKNPQYTSELESTVKWVTFFLAGRINNSHVLTQLVYSLSNLLTFFNDRTISKELNLENPGPGYILKVWLTVLDYSEVLLELSSKKLWNNAGRWIIIVCIQVLKCILRFFLMYHYKEKVLENPPIPALQRKNCKPGFTLGLSSDESEEHIGSFSFTLKHSGRLIRKVDSSPPVAFRNWKPIQRIECENNEVMDDVLAQRQTVAEFLYVIKPLVHLGSLSYFGRTAWTPWSLSLFMDVISLHLHRSCIATNSKCMTKQQRLQISRRTLALLYYLFRSPFYDRYTKNKMEGLLNTLGNNLPIVGTVFKDLVLYLPFWQNTYFYMWSS
ncbi:peroxisomal membrane protein PEX16 [Agrilus planipennis]|uniref:Peroxisomal membrane protein PEX16 n=1 Tax=Agrilus planipennis TaxID=224129 RepID=A0A1W4WR32_AGRPL|nr:peroxisomal membrane protein PEX16 [Agrilus planipennis]